MANRLPITPAQRRQIQSAARLDMQNELVRALRIVLRLRGDSPSVINAIVTAMLRQVPSTRPKPQLSEEQRQQQSARMRESWRRRRASVQDSAKAEGSG